MAQFKRNQIEEAISRLFGEQSADPSSGVRTRIKRLLDLDRSLPRNARLKRVELANYAFFDSDSPGKGAEVLFSEYEAFALLIGLQMLNHNWPQRFAVETLRRFRTELQKQHKKILSLDPQELFDKEQIRLQAQGGSPAANTASPIFLLIWSDQRQANDPAPSAGVFNQQEAFAVLMAKVGRSSTWLELTNPAHSLSTELSASLPRKRGRS
jgi:predicted DNA-binding transcriptional regulator YafY